MSQPAAPSLSPQHQTTAPALTAPATEFDGLTLPLWYPSPKYDYLAVNTAAGERTPEQHARLLLHPPPAIPQTVRQYLDAEAHKRQVHIEYTAIRRLREQLEREIARASERVPRAPTTPTLTSSAVTRVCLGKRRLRAQLEVDLTAHGVADAAALASRAADAALDIDDADRMVTQRTHVVRYVRRHTRRRAARTPLSLEELQVQLQPCDTAEQHAYSGGTNVALALLAVARHRERRPRAAAVRLRAEMATLQPAVEVWLRTCAANKFELTDGSLRLAVHAVPSVAARRLNDAAVLRVTTLLFAEQQPVALIRDVQVGMQRLGDGGDDDDGERGTKRTRTR
jgi:hypothetical protein